ncbi:MAG: tRNA (adenosine(37)-N6)-threonylcarbamoyltransferase complex ATPase subunit type 1 TsaE [Deltaproteobacteria bacterium]|nr:tRNA (adenosine(37)-N6)-threonylcarbamoyltransferase complex ATPase subunit type 1 TsaE [Deltaproteobacteria bacterium]
MRRLGACLGTLLRTGDFVGLIGDLGAGKTVLTRGIAEGAGVSESEVASPTFAIVYPYRGRALLLHHADLYRLADADELYATGFFDLLGQGATVVEWVDRVPEAMPPERLLVRLVRTGERTRRVELEPLGARHEELARELAQGYRRRAG